MGRTALTLIRLIEADVDVLGVEGGGLDRVVFDKDFVDVLVRNGRVLLGESIGGETRVVVLEVVVVFCAFCPFASPFNDLVTSDSPALLFRCGSSPADGGLTWSCGSDNAART